MKHLFFASIIAPTFLLSGCASTQNMPLVFGQSQTVGITINGSPADQAVEFSLGYKDKNFAIVPVTVKQGSGDSIPIQSQATADHKDALSVLGQFQVDAEAKVSSTNVGLGKFFATGMAAKTLADGFAAKLGKRQDGVTEKDMEIKK